MKEEMQDIEQQNNRLKETLVDVINQACQISYKDNKLILDDNCISAYEDALAYLEELGLAKHLGRGRWELV